MSNERFDDELLSAIIDGDADEATVASVLADGAASQRLDNMRTAVGIVAEEPAPASPQRRQQSIAAALAAAEPAPGVTSLSAERATRRRPAINPKVLAIAAAVLLFVLAIPFVSGLRPGSEQTATDVADTAASSELSADAAGDVVDDAVSSDSDDEAMEDVEEAMEDEDDAMKDEEEAMEDEGDDAPASTTTEATISDEAADAEDGFAPPVASLAERLASDPPAVGSANSITGVNDLIQLGSIRPVYTLDDLLDAGINPDCVSGASDVARFDIALVNGGIDSERLVIIEFGDNDSTILLDAEDCSLLG